MLQFFMLRRGTEKKTLTQNTAIIPGTRVDCDCGFLTDAERAEVEWIL